MSENTDDNSFDRDDRLAAAVLLLVEKGIRPITFEEIDRSQPGNHRRGRDRTRPTWGRRPVLAVGAVAVAIAVLLAAVVAGMGGSTKSSAAVVLDAAAGRAGSADSPVPAAGQVLVVSEQFALRGYWEGAGGQLSSYTVHGSGTWQIGVDGTGTEELSLGPGSFPTPTDRATWLALGSPTLVPQASITESFPLSAAQAQAQAAEAGLGGSPPSPTVVPYSEVAALSSDPATLAQQLVSRYESGRADPGQTFDLSAALLEEGAGSAQRAALYKVVAGLPGVRLVGPATTDATHQPGTAVALVTGGITHELIFDPATSAVLEERWTPVGSWPATLPALGHASLTGNQMLAYTLFEGVAVTGSPGVLRPRSVGQFP